MEKQVACLENSCYLGIPCQSLAFLLGGNRSFATYCPEVLVWRVLGDPVFVHVLKQIVPAKRFEEGANAGAVVCWDDGAIQ